MVGSTRRLSLIGLTAILITLACSGGSGSGDAGTGGAGGHAGARGGAAGSQAGGRGGTVGGCGVCPAGSVCLDGGCLPCGACPSCFQCMAGRGGNGGGGSGGAGAGGASAGRGGAGGAGGRGGGGGAAGRGGAGGGDDAGVNSCSYALNGTTCDVPDSTCFYEMHTAGTQPYYYGCTCGRADGGGNRVSCCFLGNAFSTSGLTPASMADWWLTPSGSPWRCPSGS